MSKDLSKAYDPQEVEDDIYKKWEESGYFNPDNLEGEPYSIMMPPPNVTGILHLGHAMENTIMDIMIRYQRMNGRKTLLLPGTDHAAVATQAKVEKILIEKGIEKPREELGREKLLNEIRTYAEESKSTILSQIRKMGTSCDWSRLAYTFDNERSHAVNTVFIKMYEDGLIYRGHRVINWSVKGQSTCSDDELEHIERPAKLYTFKYSKDFPITIATTRPETKLGDTAVAVNPKDERYKAYIGKTYTVNVGAEKPLNIKIITDPEVDKNFGTGALGVTPAHSAIDFAMYEKQKANDDPIELIQVIDKFGKMTSATGEQYKGLTVEKARDKFVTYLKENELLEKEEDITQNVGVSDRFNDVVEAIPMTQWFIDVNKKIPNRNKSLKELMQQAVKNGLDNDKSKKININPQRFEKIYFSWIDNLRDWCISRQVWWGHQIPVWYRLNSDEAEIYKSNPEEHQHFLHRETRIALSKDNPGDENDKEYWVQDPDTLDTWFSSGLWTFSTLGWPNKTKDFKEFHPTNWMQMGRDILFFWMARMVLMTTYTLDTIPFKDVYIHGLLRDKDGKKFSKSSGNAIDPIEIIESYSADALRLSCITGITPGNDLKIYNEKIEKNRNLITKLWNIGRYVANSDFNLNKINSLKDIELSTADKWILEKFIKVNKEVTENLKQYNFSIAGEVLRNFTWNDFADWYVEIHKIEKNDILLAYIYKQIVKMWHPFIPFVTEKIWQEMFATDDNNLLMIEKWTTAESLKSELNSFSSENNFDLIQELIIKVRNIRSTYNVAANENVDITLVSSNEGDLIKESESIIQKLSNVAKINIIEKDEMQKQSASDVFGDLKLYVHLENVIDIEKEKFRIEQDLQKTIGYQKGLEKRLSSEQFINKAPEQVVNQERENLKQAQEKIIKLEEHLKNLS